MLPVSGCFLFKFSIDYGSVSYVCPLSRLELSYLTLDVSCSFTMMWNVWFIPPSKPETGSLETTLYTVHLATIWYIYSNYRNYLVYSAYKTTYFTLHFKTTWYTYNVFSNFMVHSLFGNYKVYSVFENYLVNSIFRNYLAYNSKHIRKSKKNLILGIQCTWKLSGIPYI